MFAQERVCSVQWLGRRPSAGTSPRSACELNNRVFDQWADRLGEGSIIHTQLKSKWELIQNVLQQPIVDSYAIEEAILSYNQSYKVRGQP
jgi:hypothetical protein